MKIIAESTTEFPLTPGQDYAVLITGDFGGGSLILKLKNSDTAPGSELSMPDEQGQHYQSATFVFTAPCSILRVQSTSATASIDFTCTRCPR